eukprot:scaffold656188_cov46-Prasinocladus_malaysianus.AAC.1
MTCSPAPTRCGVVGRAGGSLQPVEASRTTLHYSIVCPAKADNVRQARQSMISSNQLMTDCQFFTVNSSR